MEARPQQLLPRVVPSSGCSHALAGRLGNWVTQIRHCRVVRCAAGDRRRTPARPEECSVRAVKETLRWPCATKASVLGSGRTRGASVPQQRATPRHSNERVDHPHPTRRQAIWRLPGVLDHRHGRSDPRWTSGWRSTSRKERSRRSRPSASVGGRLFHHLTPRWSNPLEGLAASRRPRSRAPR